MTENLEEFFESMLGRAPALPLPPKNASVETWDEFVGELERQDPEAFEVYRTMLKVGFHILAPAPERTGGKE
ncbi:MAG: hypothetical protein ACYCYP_03280 [Leptospirales bacterium]